MAQGRVRASEPQSEIPGPHQKVTVGKYTNEKESSSNNPSKQKACQQSVEPTVKRKGAKDAIKALTSKLQSMSPRAFMRKQAKAHVDTPTCARQLMYSSTYETCDIESRDINNSCNVTPVPVLHTSHDVNTSPSDDIGDKNHGISGLSSLLLNRVPRWGQVSSPASFRKHGKEESLSNNPSKEKACQQSVEPTVKLRNSFGKERQRGGGKITNKKYTNITMLMATSTQYSFKSKANS
ncbi:hypothetical protein Tco_0320240 [Tanacetum coccineum]